MLAGRKVLVVGGSSGFGFQVAKLALSEHADVIITGRNQQKLETAKERLKTNFKKSQIKIIVFDTADPTAYQKLLQQVKEIDHVVSTLGGAMSGGFIENTVDNVRKAVEEKFFLNLKLIKIIHSNIRPMGTITLTSGSGGHPASASGAIVGNLAINTLVKGLAIELAPNIRVNAVAPTWTPTDLWRDVSIEKLQEQEKRVAQAIPLKRVANPEEVASAYLYAIKNNFVTGQIINVDGGTSIL